MEQFIGEIRMFAGNFAPVGWALCNGQELSISEYSALFNLIGTTYGGNGETTFALPDLRGRIPIHMGTGYSGTQYSLGASGGTETVTLLQNEIPNHTHTPVAATLSGQNSPAGNVWATLPFTAYSTTTDGLQPMKSAIISVEGGNQPHDNMMPYLTINFIIALEGSYPPQS